MILKKITNNNNRIKINIKIFKNFKDYYINYYLKKLMHYNLEIVYQIFKNNQKKIIFIII